jgi:hypothetical protein
MVEGAALKKLGSGEKANAKAATLVTGSEKDMRCPLKQGESSS